MAEDRGGLDYKIDVVGDFSEKLKGFSAQVKALSAEVDALSGKLKPTSGGAKPVKRPKDPRVEEGKNLNLLQKKLLSLYKQIHVLQSKEVNNLTAIKTLTAQVAKLNQARVIAADKELNAIQNGTAAAAKQLKVEASREQSLIRVGALKKAGIRDEKKLADAASISVAKVRELLPQYERLARMRKRQASLQKQADDESIKSAQTRNKIITQQADETRRATARALKEDIRARDKIRATDARRQATDITKTETTSRKKELADLKEAMLLRDRQAKQATQARVADVASGKQAIKAEEAQAIASQRNLKSTNELAVKKAQVHQLQKSMNISQRKAAELAGVTTAQAKQLGLKMWDAEHAARQFLFTFRRLVGILAVFTAARKFAQAIAAAVNEISRFNSEIETAELSIASIVASVGQVVDSSGKMVTGADAFAASLDASRVILAELKRDAIGSIATFEALVKSYQVAIGPGLAAGLDLDQIKDVSKRLAEGAITLGVPLNQLSEEIRSLLQGTATARNTRIAVLFGGAKEANEAIRNAKEQGNLYEVLIEKLQGIAQGADAATQSFNVLKSDLIDAIQLLLAEGGIEYFDQLKESLFGLRNALTETNAEGDFVFTPEALGVVQEMAGAMAEVIASFRDVSDTGQTFIFLRNILATIGDVLKSLAPLASGIFQGLITGANLALAPLRALSDILRAVARALGFQRGNKALAKVVKFLVAGATALFIWRKLLIVLPVLLGKAAFHLNVIGFRFFKIVVSQALIQAQQLGINVGTAAWNVLLAGVVLKMALITGGITVLVGLLAFAVTKTKLFEKWIGLANNELKGATNESEELANSIRSAGDATAEGAKSAKEWADALKEAKKQTAVIQATAGLRDETEKLVKLLVEETAEYKKQAETQQGTLTAAKLRKKELEDEVKLLQQASIGEFRIEGFDLEDVSVPNLQQEMDDLLQDVVGNVAVNLTGGVDQDFEDTANTVVRLNKDIGLETGNIAHLEERLKELREDSLAVLREHVKQLTAQNTLINEQQTVGLAEDAAKVAKLSTARASDAVKELAATQAQATVLAANIDLETKRRGLALSALQKEIALVDGVAGREAELVVLQEQFVRETEKGASAMELENAQMAELEQRLERTTALASNDFVAGMREGLDMFVEGVEPMATQLADIISGSLNDIAGIAGDLFKDAIDPRTDADLQTAFGEFFLDLAGQFVEAITQQLIASALTKIGFGEEAKKAVADQRLITALDRNSTAQELSNTKAGTPAPGAAPAPAIEVPAGGGGGGGDQAAAKAASSAGGFLGGLGSVAPWLMAIFIPIIIALLTSAFKKGGKVQGFASGGDVNKLPRPSNIPASDTVPAWLTPGEFVMRKEAVQKYGTGIMDAINRGVLRPSSFGSTVAPVMQQRQRGVRAFAAGGAVAGGRAGREAGSSPQTVVLPIQVASENNMEQMIAGGRSAFASNVNKSPRIGDPNASSSW